MNAADARVRELERSDNILDEFPGREPLPEIRAIGRQTLAEARVALGDRKLLDVFDLWVEGFSQVEIKEALGISVTTIGRRMAEIWARLRVLATESDSDEL